MKKSTWNLILLGLSVFGAIVSAVLIMEYFGQARELVGSLCSATGGGDSCAKVAESNYSAFRDIPFIGDLPVALLGFIFYGVLGSLYWKAFRKPEEEEALWKVAIVFLIIGLFVDLGLFLLSELVIGTLCTLCGITYLITIALLAVNVSRFRKEEYNWKGTPVWLGIVEEAYGILATGLLLAAIGILFGKAVSSTDTLTTDKSLARQGIQAEIQKYDSASKVQIDLTNIPVVGDENAPITIVKYADFNCGHCMHTSHILHEFLGEYQGVIKVAYKNFPLDGTCNRLVQRKAPEASSCVAASAAICANKQNKFQEMYTALYADNERGVMHTPSTIMQNAKALGLNIQAFQACMGSDSTRAQIEKEVDEADVLNVQATPTLYVNNKPIASGTPNPAFLRALINHILGRD